MTNRKKWIYEHPQLPNKWDKSLVKGKVIELYKIQAEYEIKVQEFFLNDRFEFLLYFRIHF